MYEVQMFIYAHSHSCDSRCKRGKCIGKRFLTLDEGALTELIPGPKYDLPFSGGLIKRNVSTFKGEQGTIKVVSIIKKVVEQITTPPAQNGKQ